MRPLLSLSKSLLARRLLSSLPLGGAALVVVLTLSGPVWAQQKRVPESQQEMLLSYAPVVRKVAPAVVNIYTSRTVEQRNLSGLLSDPFFQKFFGERLRGHGERKQKQQNSLGSGVVVSETGLVVTNNHVIKGADEIRIALSDRREFDADVVLTDERADLAVLQIRDLGDEKLAKLAYHDSDEIEVGDLVLAIGNPFGVGQTVTSGIVSALARTQVGVADYSFFIQTDAAINPGNSGGALVTMDGRLLGINTAIFSKSGGSIGIGFAIPSNMVRSVVDGAVNGGEIIRPWVGVTGQDLTGDLAAGFGLEIPGGVVINEVYPKGPADQAGVRKGDVVLAIDGRKVVDTQSLRFRVATRRPEGNAVLSVWRKGKTRDLVMPLQRAPEKPSRNVTLLDGRQPLAGATVANLSPRLAEELDIAGLWDGVIVLELVRNSPAGRLGLRPGDLMVSVNDQSVGSVKSLRKLLASAPKSWKISINRGGKIKTVQIADN
jgi:serine protease Do|tara:strand:+ start:5979 stop:7448 length:1470 start_codon:yes stop_codon:yes gene_type:complete